MISEWDKKMIPTSILIVLILIRHTVIATYTNDWNGIIQNQQSLHLEQAAGHQELQLINRQHRHHHKANAYMNSRETRIKSKQNESKDRTMIQTKTTSKNYNPSLILPNHDSFEAATATVGTDHNPRQIWSHTNRQFHHVIQHQKDRSLQALTSHNVLEKSTRISYVYPGNRDHEDQGIKVKNRVDKNNDNKKNYEERSSQIQNNPKQILKKQNLHHYVDPTKISHEYQEYKSKDEYDEYYDYNSYDVIDYNEERREKTEIEGEIPDYMLDESDSRGEEMKNVMEHENVRRQGVDQNSEEYLNDDFNPLGSDQTQNMSLTDRKWKVLGTPDAVRDQFLKHKVSENIERLRAEGRCRWPHPKVIPVIEASDLLRPHCVILHRCADDTGCCNDGKTCVAKSTSFVDLYFYITPFDNRSKTSIGYRTFENHTECHCVQRSRFRRTIKQHSVFNFGRTTPSTKHCRCPSHFRVLKEETLFRCECLSWDQNCIALKEGKTLFSYEDQKCIAENKCQKPSCVYGIYNKNTGRCPRLSGTLS